MHSNTNSADTAQTETTAPPSEAPPQPGTRRGKRRVLSLLGQARDRGILWVVDRILKGQRRFGDYMNQRTRMWQPRHQRLFLVVFVGLFQIGCMLLMWALSASRHTPAVQTIQPAANVPPAIGVAPRLTRSDSASIILFRQKLDSLMSTQSGRDSVASFNRSHPGFIDSVLRLGAQLQLPVDHNP